MNARRFKWRGGGVYRINGHIAVCPTYAPVLCLASLCAERGAQLEVGPRQGARSDMTQPEMRQQQIAVSHNPSILFTAALLARIDYGC